MVPEATQCQILRWLTLALFFCVSCHWLPANEAGCDDVRLAASCAVGCCCCWLGFRCEKPRRPSILPLRPPSSRSCSQPPVFLNSNGTDSENKTRNHPKDTRYCQTHCGYCKYTTNNQIFLEATRQLFAAGRRQRSSHDITPVVSFQGLEFSDDGTQIFLYFFFLGCFIFFPSNSFWSQSRHRLENLLDKVSVVSFWVRSETYACHSKVVVRSS